MRQGSRALTHMELAGFGTNVTPSTHKVFVCSTQNAHLDELVLDDFNFESLMRQLTPREQVSVLNKNQRSKALVIHLFQRIVLNYAMFLNSDVSRFDPMSRPAISFNAHGKPHLAHSNIQFNSSTSDDLTCVVAQFGLRSPVGIDVSHENQAAISGTDYVAHFAPIFSDQEARLLDGAATHEKYHLFNQLWTLKEAFTKFLGCGLNTDLKQFWFSCDPSLSKTANHSSFLRPSDVGGSCMSERSVTWREVAVNLDGMANEWKARIGAEPVRCSTAVLAHNSQVPLFVSVVAQSDLKDIKVYELDMARIVQQIVDQDV